MVVGFYFMGRSITLLYRGSNRPGVSADLMEIKRTDAGKPIRNVVAKRVYLAYLDLKGRNRIRMNNLVKAESALQLGLVSIFGAGLLYFLGSFPAKISPEDRNNDNPAIHTPATEKGQSERHS
jgi:hypothetical protein